MPPTLNYFLGKYNTEDLFKLVTFYTIEKKLQESKHDIHVVLELLNITAVVISLMGTLFITSSLGKCQVKTSDNVFLV